MVVNIIKNRALPTETEAHARNTDPDTSHAAAAYVEGHLPHLEGVVLEWLQNHPPGTVDDIALGTGLQTETVSPRMRPLERKGFIRATEKRRALPGKKVGRIVWEVVR